MLSWIQENSWLAAAMAASSVLVLVGSAIAVPIWLGRLPTDYFVHFADGNSSRSLFIRVTRFGFGMIFIFAGILMLVLPGQGLLTILAGILMLEFPGRRRMLLATLRTSPVRGMVQWIRRRRGRPEFEIPEPDADAPSDSIAESDREEV